MKRRISIVLFTVLTFPLLLFGFGPARNPALKRSTGSFGRQLRLNPDYGKLPLAFEPNRGQTDPQVQYLSHGSGYTLFLTSGEAVLSLHRPQSDPRSKFFGLVGRQKIGKIISPSTPGTQTPPVVLHMKLEGAQAGVSFESQESLPGISNYFIGKDRAQWRANIPQYAKVQAHEVYPGVDMVYYGNQGKLEYDFVVKPGTAPKTIHLKYEGAKSATVNAQGDLELEIEGGKVIFRAPTVYQETEGQRNSVEGRYQMEEGGRIGFEVKDYDRSKPLVIDPELDYSTYLGGSGADLAFAIAVDGLGNAYVTGETPEDFPTTSGAFQTANGGNEDAFVTKLNPTGSALVYSTYLGGSALDAGEAIAVDGSGNAYVTGFTLSTDFPTTSGSYQPIFAGSGDSFVTELSPSGNALVYSTFLGGGNATQGIGIALDSTGNAYLTGQTEGNFPTTAGAYQSVYSGVVATYAAKLDPTGSFLIYGTYLDGNEGVQPFGVAVDGSGNAYVTGFTNSSNFPTTPGAYQTVFGGIDLNDFNAFVTKFNPTGTGVFYSTYLGGNSEDFACGIALDSAGDAFVAGYTSSPNFPTTSGAYQTVYNTVGYDSFITQLNPAGTALVYSTFFGGGQQVQIHDIALDSLGNAYVTGNAAGGFPTTAGAYQTVFGGAIPTSGCNVFMSVLNPAGDGANDLIYSTYLGGERF